MPKVSPGPVDVGPVFGSRATPSNNGWRVFFLSCLIITATEVAYAEQLGAELLAAAVASPMITPRPDQAFGERVVVGIESAASTIRPQRLLSDHQFERILHDFEMRLELERKFSWRLQSAYRYEVRSPFAVGYDPGERPRLPLRYVQLELPMDLVRPAVFIGADF